MEEKRIPQLRFPEFQGEWKYGKLRSDVLSSAFGPRFSSDLYSENGSIATLRTTDMDLEGNINYETMPLADLKKSDFENHLLQNNDLLVSRSGTIGITGVFKKQPIPVLPGAFLIRFRLDLQKLNAHFIKYLFNSTKGRYKLNSLSAGGVQKNLTGTNLLNAEYSTPSLPEQEKIAAFLTAVDKHIGLLTEKKAQLEQYKKGVMQQLFSQQIRFTQANGTPYPDWEEKKMKDLCKINQGLQIAISERLTTEVENSLFYITNEFLRADSSTRYYILNAPDSVKCEVDDILMTRTGNTGKVVTGVKGAFHNNFFKIKYDTFKIIKGFLFYFLNATSTQNLILRLAGTSTIPDLNHSDFYKIPIVLPSLPEQQKIAEFLSAIDARIATVQQQITQTQTWKQGLLQGMFV